jgi:alkylation response protein AidB-like acyl-CoA dehydrogenase
MNDEISLYRDTIQRFMEKEIVPNQEDWAGRGCVDRAVWDKAAEAGVLAASIPEAYGGLGGTLALDAVVLLEQGRIGDVGFGFGVHNILTHYIVAFGTEAQKQRWLPQLASGERIGAIAMTEPGTGSDLQNVRTSATLKDGEYLVNGSKTFITNGQMADLLMLVVRTGEEARASSISLLILDLVDLPGFRRGRNLDKIGMKANDTSELFLDDVRVPQEDLLGGVEGQGFYQLMQQLPWERLQIGLVAVGYMEGAINHTLAYVKDRKAFGRAIFDFQNTRFKLAECKTKLEVTRAFVDRCLEQNLEGKLDAATASMAKWWASQTQCEVMDECLQLHGGYGYMTEYPISRYYVDSRVQKIYGGTNEIMKELIARSL